MKPQAGERALRAMVAALLGSGLPPSDIREAANLLTRDSEFAERFTAMLEAVLAQLPAAAPSRRPVRANGRKPVPANGKTSSRGARTADSEVEAVLRILHAVRSTKKELLGKLASHPALSGWRPSPHWSRRQIAESLVEKIPRAQLPEVLAAATVGQGPVDPWLEALHERERERNGSR